MIRRNIGREQQVWGRLGVVLRREGADPIMSVAFYRAVVQEFLFFRVGTWFLSETMDNWIAGVHMEFLRRVAGKQAIMQQDVAWQREGAKRVLKSEGTQYIHTYIYRRQAKVSQLLSLQKIF